MTTNMAVVPDSGSSAEGADTHRDAVKPMVFGLGRFVVDTGRYHQAPAVFICPVDEPGEVGASSRHLGHDRHSLLPGEQVMTFPTHEQAQAVADALVGQAPVSPAEQVETDWIEWAGGENPVPGAMIDTRLRNGLKCYGHANQAMWVHMGHGSDILAYRVVAPADRGIG